MITFMDYKIPKQIGSYVMQEVIGVGAFSIVYQAYDNTTRMKVAIKVIKKTKLDPERFKREITLLKGLDNPFCVSFFENLEDENNYYLIMEFIQGRTLLTLIKNKGPLPEWLCRHIFCQLISALEYLHETKKMVHRDLKTENIILDRCGNIRLIDFGLSNTFVDDNNLLKTACGSPAYAPPEMFKGEKYNSTADLWSAGVILYTMAVGKLPFEEKNMKKLIEKIVSSEPEYPAEMDPFLVDLLHRMLMKDKSCRMSIQKIREHSWFMKYHFASIMNADFGILQGLKLHGENVLDKIIITQLDKIGLNSVAISELAKSDVFTSEVTPYRILHRYQVAQNMRGMYSTAEKSELEKALKLTNKKSEPTRSTPLMSFNIDPNIVRRTLSITGSRRLSLCMPANYGMPFSRMKGNTTSRPTAAKVCKPTALRAYTIVSQNATPIRKPRRFSLLESN